jgi:hypothetical protein
MCFGMVIYQMPKTVAPPPPPPDLYFTFSLTVYLHTHLISARHATRPACLMLLDLIIIIIIFVGEEYKLWSPAYAGLVSYIPSRDVMHFNINAAMMQSAYFDLIIRCSSRSSMSEEHLMACQYLSRFSAWEQSSHPGLAPAGLFSQKAFTSFNLHHCGA